MKNNYLLFFLGLLVYAGSVRAGIPDASNLPVVETLSFQEKQQEKYQEKYQEKKPSNAFSEESHLLVELRRRIEVLREEMQALSAQVEEQGQLLKELADRQKTLYLDLDQRIAQHQVETVQDLTQLESQMYQQAFQRVQQKDYILARQALETYLVRFPKGQYLPNVYYWLGEVELATKHYASAAVYFEKVIGEYGQHPKASDALLKLGYVFEEQGDREQALERFQEVQKRFPGTAAARLAGARLQRVKH